MLCKAAITHSMSMLPTHVPLPQVSPVVQASPSLQLPVMFEWTQPRNGLHASSVHCSPSLQLSGPGDTQAPVAGLQVSLPLQRLPSSQVTGVPVHEPPPQLSPVVQRSPSSQLLELLVNTQPAPGTQASVVHGLKSSQTSGPELTQPSTGSQDSKPLQMLPSSHTS